MNLAKSQDTSWYTKINYISIIIKYKKQFYKNSINKSKKKWEKMEGM